MSLTDKQKEATRRELAENLLRSGQRIEEVATGIGADTAYVRQLLALQLNRLEDTWILRNYLLDAVRAAGRVPVTFTALKGDWHGYPFLDGSYIDDGRIG